MIIENKTSDVVEIYKCNFLKWMISKKINQNKKQTSIYNVNVVKLCKSLVYKNYFVQYEKVS